LYDPQDLVDLITSSLIIDPESKLPLANFEYQLIVDTNKEIKFDVDYPVVELSQIQDSAVIVSLHSDSTDKIVTNIDDFESCQELSPALCVLFDE
jgi:hypothetical protein